jgi:hydroxyethylthiazole kinase
MQKNVHSISSDLTAIRATTPLVHNITNFVVMNNTANALLALGASPVMAHAQEEVEEMTTLGAALVINIGTLSSEWLESMLLAMRAARRGGIPIIFDPVGAGATSFRTEACLRLLKQVNPDVIRGNASEIMALSGSRHKTRGVDSGTPGTDASEEAIKLAHTYKSVVCVSGEVDLITDGKNTARVYNGDPMMPKVTGLGCTASAVIGAFCGVNNNYLDATTHAMTVMGVCGELAARQAHGPGTLQLHFIDSLYNLNDDSLSSCARVEFSPAE